MSFEQLNPAACRTYLLSDSKEAVLVDPVIDHVSDYLKLLKERNLKLTHVVDTHTHADHISAGPSMRDATDCEYIMHEIAPAKCVTIRVQDGDELILAGQKAKVIETPGHTKDSISLLFEDKFLTGDFLFLEDAGAGRDDLPGGSAESHWNSLQKVKNFDGNIIVYPAHEYRERTPSSLDNQRAKNPHLKDMSKQKFTSYINDLKLGPADWMKDVLKANYRCATDPNAVWIPVDVPACEIKGTLNPNTANIEVHYISIQEMKEKESPILID
ncbi:MAG: MBL fold metallo-hydrolase, partial [Clostridiales bacterium]|nr:MBL fold metallo-hydrolase [Clostridiales bacterium]